MNKFKILLMAGRISETRKDPEIPIAGIFLLMVISLALGRRSFHQIDIFARVPFVRRLLGGRKNLVASDTTLQRVVPDMSEKEVREELQKSYIIWRRQGRSTFGLSSKRKLRIGLIDGSGQGGGMVSCLQVVADRGRFLLDLEPCKGKGNEVASSKAVLSRAWSRHGRAFVDMLLQDPLYVNAPFWNECRDHGVHVLVKGEKDKGERLLVLQEARALCASQEKTDLVERVSGVDAARGVSYSVSAVSGLEHQGYNGTLKVALVEERRLKPRRGKKADLPDVSSFWVIVTDESLTPDEMRELGHLRWSIENQGFRSLSAHLHSKATWTRGKRKEETLPILLLLMFLAFNLVTEFQATKDVEDILKDLEQDDGYRPHAITLRLVVERIIDTLGLAEPLICGA